MAFKRALKRYFRIVLAPAVFLTLAVFFGWSATQGNRGLVAYAQREDLLRQLRVDQMEARAERDAWERRVSGLRASHLQLDTLDERARAMLNLAEPNDIVVQYGPKDKMF